MEQVKRPNTNTSTIQNTEINKFIVELQGLSFACCVGSFWLKYFLFHKGKITEELLLQYFVISFCVFQIGILEN